jgi:flagellar FliL protein
LAEKKPAKADEGKTAGKGGMSMAQNAIGFVVAGAIAAGVGVGIASMNKPAEPAAAPKAEAKPGGKPAEGEGREAAPAAMGSMDIPPVVTNLASPHEVWIRVEGAVVFEGAKLPRGDALAAEIAADLLAYLRTLTLEQIQGVAGLEHLRSDINERVRTRSQGLVKTFIIKALVVQ